MIEVTHFSDPGCPWAWSARPAHAVLRWRYGDALQWRLVTIGLTEHADQYVERGYTPAGQARGYRNFRWRGMPFATEPRERVAGTGRACRAIVATRLLDAALEEPAFRALQIAWFTTPAVLDQDAAIGAALRGVDGLDVDAVLGALDDPAVEDAYQADRAAARTAENSATDFQGKAARTDGPVRYTAPSLIFSHSDGRLEAGGFQPVEAYDALIANLDRGIGRRPPPDDPLPRLEAFPYPLATAEVAALLAQGNLAPDRPAAEGRLIDLVAAGRARRVAAGDGAFWSVA